jgi:hypothetical protein
MKEIELPDYITESKQGQSVVKISDEAEDGEETTTRA